MCSVSTTSSVSVVKVALGRPVDPEVILSTAAPRQISGFASTPAKVRATRPSQNGPARTALSTSGVPAGETATVAPKREANARISAAVAPASTGITGMPAPRQASQNGNTAGRLPTASMTSVSRPSPRPSSARRCTTAAAARSDAVKVVDVAGRWTSGRSGVSRWMRWNRSTISLTSGSSGGDAKRRPSTRAHACSPTRRSRSRAGTGS